MTAGNSDSGSPGERPVPAPPGIKLPLLDRLAASSPVVRANALLEADRLSPAALSRELAGFEKLADPSGNRGFTAGCCGMVVGFPAILILAVVGTCAGPDSGPMVTLMISMGLIAIVGSGIGFANAGGAQRERAYRVVEMLTKCRNRGAVGALLSATELPRKDLPLPIRAALTRLLAEFEEGDERLLNPNQRDLLYGYRSITARADVAHQLAMLHAISVFGTQQALTKARSMRTLAAAGVAERPELAAVVEAAEAAEKAIEARIAARENSRQLLRPATCAADNSALLRPAGASQDPEETLLRATDGP
jgi:hypothetical protein